MRLLCIYSSLIALIAAVPMVFNSLFLVPKVRYEMEQLNAVQSYGLVAAPLGFGSFFLIASLVGAIAGIVFLSLAASSKGWGKVNEKVVSCGLAPGSFLLFVLASWHSMAVWSGASSLNSEYRGRQDSYHMILNEFSLKEEIDGRMDRAKRLYNLMSEAELREIDDFSEKSFLVQGSRCRGVLNELRKETEKENYDQKKVSRLLATVGNFRGYLSRGSSHRGTIIKTFSNITGEELATTDEVFDWIEDQNDERWEPYQLYEVVLTFDS